MFDVIWQFINLAGLIAFIWIIVFVVTKKKTRNKRDYN